MYSLVFSDSASALRLIGKVRSVGIKVPLEVNAESKLYQDIRQEQSRADRTKQLAVNKLTSVPIAEFDSARAALSEASAAANATQDVNAELLHAAGLRLTQAVARNVPSWEVAVVKKFNDVVAEFDLNEAARNLPNLADTQNATIMRIGREQGEAVQKWRDAAWLLHPIWDAYQALTMWCGYDNPSKVDAGTRSIGYLTACRLGHPRSFDTADAVATSLVEATACTNNMIGWDSLVPFIIPAIHGYPLHLSTTSDATRIRNQIQFGAAA